ncbi:MAG: retropepsin-like aspartic protease family protein [Pikeienuella sp.]
MVAFWPIALIIAIVVVVAQLNVNFPGALGEAGAQERLVYLSALLIGFVGFSLRGRALRMKPAAQATAIWVGVLTVAVAGYAYRHDLRPVFDQIRGEVSPTIAIARQEGEVALKKAWDGHFRAVTKINGEKVGMLVDTGASLVLLSYEDAEAIGLEPEKMRFSIPVITANGRAHVASVTLDSVQVGEIGLFGVRAAVAEKGKLHSSLLGMSFLSRIQETSFKRDTLVLRN